MTKSLTEQYKKGYSPSALQNKYSLTYEQGYELAQEFKKLEQQLAEANEVIEKLNVDNDVLSAIQKELANENDTIKLQLLESNEILKIKNSPNEILIGEYLKKWGVR